VLTRCPFVIRWSINWFANELRQAQAKEEEAERLRKQSKERDWKERGEVADSEADDEGEDTETEHGLAQSTSDVAGGRSDSETGVPEQQAVGGAPEDEVRATGTTNGIGPQDGSRLRRPAEQDRSGDVSSCTDSEWEKVDGTR
jgi:hypothetical protein